MSEPQVDVKAILQAIHKKRNEVEFDGATATFVVLHPIALHAIVLAAEPMFPVLSPDMQRNQIMGLEALRSADLPVDEVQLAIEVVVGDELIEIEEQEGGVDATLAFYVHRAKEAADQIKAWERKSATARAAIDRLQEAQKAAYDTSFGTIVVSRRGPSFTTKVDKDGLLTEELTRTDLEDLLRAAGDIKVSEFLKRDDPLALLVREYSNRVPKSKGYIVLEVGTKYAPE